jgi:hypothetical protein
MLGGFCYIGNVLGRLVLGILIFVVLRCVVHELHHNRTQYAYWRIHTRLFLFFIFYFFPSCGFWNLVVSSWSDEYR